MYMVRFLCKFTSHYKVQITTFHLIVKCLQQQTMSFSYCVALMMDHVTFVIGELTCTCPRLVIDHKVTFIGLKSKSKIQIMFRYEWNTDNDEIWMEYRAVEFKKERSNRCTPYLSVESRRDCHLVIKTRHNLIENKLKHDEKVVYFYIFKMI